MIGWCAVSMELQAGEPHRSRSQTVHGSSNCHRLKGGNPWQVWVEGDRVWLPPFDRTTPGGRFKWCQVCEPQPALPDWMRHAHCRGADPNIFFAGQDDERTAQSQIAEAKALCTRCGVVRECRDWGMGEAYGVWGGMSRCERERARVKETV